MSTATELDTDILNDVDMDDPTKTHVIWFPAHMPSGDVWAAHAREHGLEVEALCGYKFVPKSDPLKHPVCEACLKVAQELSAGNS